MRSPEETKALVEQSTKLLERVAKLQKERDEAQASLDVARRIVAVTVLDADRRDDAGEPCWCHGLDLGAHIGEPSHELGCSQMRSFVRRLVAALEVQP